MFSRFGQQLGKMKQRVIQSQPVKSIKPKTQGDSKQQVPFDSLRAQFSRIGQQLGKMKQRVIQSQPVKSIKPKTQGDSKQQVPFDSLRAQFSRIGQQLGKMKQRVIQSQPVESIATKTQADSQQRVPSDSLRAMFRRAIADAEEVASDIKKRAQAEAEAEARRIIAQAELQVRERNEGAEIDAQRKTDEIMSEANKKATTIEVEARQRALLFLARSSEELAKQIGQEYERAYSRLNSSLQQLVAEGQNTQKELRDRVANLLETSNSKLLGFEANLLDTSQVVESSAEESTPAIIETAIEGASKQEVEDSIQPEGEELKEYLEESVQPEGEAPEEKIRESFQPEIEVIEEGIKEPIELEEEIVEEKVEGHIELEAEAAAPGLAYEPSGELREQHLTKKGSRRRKDESVAPILDEKELYRGEVEFVIPPQTELQLVSKVYDYLLTIPDLRILYTKGSWDQGTIITVTMEQPMPLMRLMLKIPGVAVTPNLVEEDTSVVEKSSLSPGEKEKIVKRIKLILYEDNPK